MVQSAYNIVPVFPLYLPPCIVDLVVISKVLQPFTEPTLHMTYIWSVWFQRCGQLRGCKINRKEKMISYFWMYLRISIWELQLILLDHITYRLGVMNQNTKSCTPWINGKYGIQMSGWIWPYATCIASLVSNCLLLSAISWASSFVSPVTRAGSIADGAIHVNSSKIFH